MKVVILAGGFGTRISEESVIKPKPMIEIGYKPILWHIMKMYSHFGFNEFVICLGYKGYVIKEYFDHYFLHESDITYDFSKDNEQVVHGHSAEPWKVTLVNTGLNTMTGGRVKRIQPYIGNEPFLLTYGDGVADVDINKLLLFHQSHGKMVTVTAVQPSGRFGVIDIDQNNKVMNFWEKPKSEASWISGGFFVMDPRVFDYIEDDRTILEKTPLVKITEEGELRAFKHTGFWQCMDKMSDKALLEDLWGSGKAPWKLWKDRI
ncbi:MAG: glucose-1-phosphate cytidylyltransferase [Chitinispirillaceae bacterium]|jgi:glucose-1-phosphate cytidylyltransferase|nr:glucose-1-phosphate cytidylyltransferase [Chitinispirillaceae bacterium]